MNPRKVEWKDGDCWRQAKKLGWSRNGNLTFGHQGKWYVLKSLLEGTEVSVLEAGKWVKAGRVDHYGVIFLGPGETFSEALEQQNRGKTTEQIISELHSFMNPCPSLDRAQKAIDSLKSQSGKEASL